MRALEFGAVGLAGVVAGCSLVTGCGGAPALTEDRTINVKVESPVPIGFYTRAYQPYVATPSSASTPTPPPTAEKLCDAPCATPVTIGPHRLFWVGDETGGASVDLPAEKDVIVTVRPGDPTATTVGGALAFGGGVSILIGSLLFIVPTDGPDVLSQPTFVAGIVFGGAGVVAGAIGLPLVAAFEVKADARPAVGPK